jgi:hypothetical protein
MQRLGKNPPIVTRKRLGKSPPVVGGQQLSNNPLCVARQRLGNNPLSVARHRLGKNPVIGARQWLGKDSPIVARQRIKKSRRLVLPRTSCLYYEITLLSVCLSVCPHNCFVFYAIRVVSTASRRLVLPRTSCNLLCPGLDCTISKHIRLLYEGVRFVHYEIYSIFSATH